MSPEPTSPTKPVLPSGRTVQKAGRDFGLAVLGFCVVYTTTHQADLGLNPELTAAISPLAMFAYRWLRGLLGGEPA